MQFYPHRTVEEQANRLPYELREAYKNSQIDRITIFDGKEELEVTGYAEYSYLEEKSYKTQPVRTQNGAIEEIEEYATFLTPRLIIKYNMMGIEDYRSLMKMFKRRNGYIVKCYDVVEDQIAKKEMYVAPPSMPKIYHQYLVAMGIQEHTIELIGTNTLSNMDFYYRYATNGTLTAGFGQTWREYCNSEYNTRSFYIIENTNEVRGNEGFVYDNKNRKVDADEFIFDNITYYAT